MVGGWAPPARAAVCEAFDVRDVLKKCCVNEQSSCVVKKSRNFCLDILGFRKLKKGKKRQGRRRRGTTLQNVRLSERKEDDDDDERVKKEMIAGSVFLAIVLVRTRMARMGARRKHAPPPKHVHFLVDDEIEQCGRLRTSCRDRRVAKRRSRAERASRR